MEPEDALATAPPEIFEALPPNVQTATFVVELVDLLRSILPQGFKFSLDFPLPVHDPAIVNVRVLAIRIAQFVNRNTSACPYCGATVERLAKPGAPVYNKPCGCRLWRGPVPPAWRHAS